MSGGNGYIDPHKAIGKLKTHGKGLWGMQAVVAFVMSVIAVIAGKRDLCKNIARACWCGAWCCILYIFILVSNTHRVYRCVLASNVSERESINTNTTAKSKATG